MAKALLLGLSGVLATVLVAVNPLLAYLTHPLTYGAAAALGAGAWWLLLALHGCPRAGKTCGAAAAAVSLAMYLGPYAPRMEFARAVRVVEPGMERTEVEAHLASFRPGHPYGYLGIMEDRPWLRRWHHGQGDSSISADHCEVRFGSDGRVRHVKLILD